MNRLDGLSFDALLKIAQEQRRVLEALLQVERGRVARLSTANPELSSRAELAQARAWADAVEAVKL